MVIKKDQLIINFKKKYPYKVQMETFDGGAWRKREVAYADKKTMKELTSKFKKAKFKRYKLL